MALNIKDPETERLAGEVAALAGESKTGAVRQALKERKQRLLFARRGLGRGDRMVAFLEEHLWPQLPSRWTSRNASPLWRRSTRQTQSPSELRPSRKQGSSCHRVPERTAHR